VQRHEKHAYQIQFSLSEQLIAERMRNEENILSIISWS